jgi:hypothetical protein
MNRRILISVITSAIQTLLYYLVFFIGWTFGTMIHEPTPMTISEAVGLGAFLKVSIVLFGIIILSMNLIDAIANQKKWTWGLLISMTVYYVIYWGQPLNYIPLKTGLILITGLLAIYSKFPIEKLLNRLIAAGTPSQHES